MVDGIVRGIAFAFAMPAASAAAIGTVFVVGDGSNAEARIDARRPAAADVGKHARVRTEPKTRAQA